jgi:hypothetical protein
MLEPTLTAEPGEGTVRFAFTVSNADDQPVDLRFRDACRADVAVADGDREVWRWSDGRMFTQAVEEADLAPGESAEFSFEWEDPDPGEYRVTAELRLLDKECSAETNLRLE